jgi:glutamate--cysteine ligase
MAMALDNSLLTTRAAAEAFVGGVCFKLGPPALIGAELEWLTVRQASSNGDCPDLPTLSTRPSLATIAAALGPHAPKSLDPSSPADPLPRGSYITIEPGGQIEISSAPFSSAEQLCRSLQEDEEYLRTLLATESIAALARSADVDRPPERLLRASRYTAMEDRFASIGPFGTLMMCNTAATQVSVDAGRDATDVAARWNALDATGPALLAAFACSPTLAGAPGGRWASQRMRTWLQLDRSRTSPPLGDSTDPIARYAQWALDVPLLCVVGEQGANWAAPPDATFADWIAGSLDDLIDRRPTRCDLSYHLTTLFPPVRASGHLEVRYIDAQPGHLWAVPIHVLDALLSTPESVASATALAAGTAHRWWDAAEFGLADAELRATGVSLFELAAEHTEWPDACTALRAAAQRCRNGVAPGADERGEDAGR